MLLQWVPHAVSWSENLSDLWRSLWFATNYRQNCPRLLNSMQYAVEANSLTLRADISWFERVQRHATRLVRGHRHVPYEERLHQLNHFSLERRRLRADLVLAFRIFQGEVDLCPSDFFLRPARDELREHTYRLLQEPIWLRWRSDAFPVCFVKYWNRSPAPLSKPTLMSMFK